MSNSPISSPNEVSTKSTFEDWRQITNQIIKRLNSLYSESGANGTSDDNLHVWNDATIGTSGLGNLNVTGNIEVGKDLIIENDLIVKGSTTTVNTVDLIVKDRMIELNHDPFYRNHPYNDKLKSGLQVHVGVDDNDIIVSYESDLSSTSSFSNFITEINYQIGEGEEYQIDKDKTDLIMSKDEPEVTLIFDSFSRQKTGDLNDKFVVGDKIKGHTSGAEAVIKSIVPQNSNLDVEIRINYLESVYERDSVFEIGEYVYDPNETEQNIDAALDYMQQWNPEGSKVQTVQNNQSLSSLDLSNKKYVLRFKDINDQVDNKMFLVDTYDIDTKKLTIVGDASEYKTQHQYLIDLDFQIQEIKTQKFYWDEATKKWTLDYDLNVLGDIYSNGKTLWKIVPNQDSQIYYNGNVAVGKTVGDYTSPLAKLHIVSDTDDLIRLNDWKFSKSNDDLKLSFNTNNLTFKSDNDDNIILDSNGSIKLSSGVIRNSSGSLTSPSYTFHNADDTGISLQSGLNFSVDGENVFRVTKPDGENTTTDGAVIEKGGLVIRPSDVNPSPAIEGLIRYNQSTKDFEGYRGINPNGTGDWYSFTSSNDSGGAYTVYSKSLNTRLSDHRSNINVPNTVQQYYWYTKLTIPTPTQTADYIYNGKEQGNNVYCDFYSFDFYGYMKNRILNNSYTDIGDKRGYGTTDSEVFHYKFYVERDFNVIDNSGTKEVVLNTDIKIKKIEGIDVEERSLEGFQFWSFNTDNNETVIYFRWPIGYSGIEIVDNSILSEDFEKLEGTWFQELEVMPHYLDEFDGQYHLWPPQESGVPIFDDTDDYINIEQMSLWKTNSTDRNKIYYDGGDTGFVGIGLDNPLTELHVNGTIRASSLIDTNANKVLVSNLNGDIEASSITTDALNQLSGIDITEGSKTIEQRLDDLSTDIGNIDTSKWTQKTDNNIYRNTNVGIGDFNSTDLTEKLVVDGDIGLDGNVIFKDNNVERASVVYSSITEELYLVSRNTDAQNIITETSLLIGDNKLNFVDSTSTPYPILHEGNSWAVRDISGNIHYSSGNVGIGTSTPSEKLHVDGDSFIDGVLKLKPKQISKILSASDGELGDYFGHAVSLSSDGSVLAVGAYGWDASGTYNSQGAVYIYDWSGSSWVQRGSVLNAETNADPSDHFGSSVSLSSDGSVLAVGAYRWDTTSGTQGVDGDNRGAVYVYDRDGSTWTLRSVLTADTGISNSTQDIDSDHDGDYFGRSVALSDDGKVLAVGAYYWDGSSPNQGGVYVYDKNGDSWTLRGNVLTADTGISNSTQDTDTGHGNDLFGTSVSLSSDGSVLVVGAVWWDGSSQDQGGVYIYDRNGDSWTLRGNVLTADTGISNSTQDPDSSKNDNWFGGSVSLSSDGSVLAVGCTLWDGSSEDQGGVYIYDKNGDSWTLRGNVLTASDYDEYDFFGRSVSLSSDGSVLVVGAQEWDRSEHHYGPQHGDNLGAAYTYSLEANSFLLSVSDKGYGLNVINDNIVLNSDVEVTGSISEDGTLLSAKYAPIDIETSKWTDINTGIYRDSNVGIGDFSSTDLTEKFEIRNTSSSPTFLKIKSDSDTNQTCGIKMERKCQGDDNNWTYRNYEWEFRYTADLNLSKDGSTIYYFDDSELEHVFEDKVKVNSSITIGDFSTFDLSTASSSSTMEISAGVNSTSDKVFRVWGIENNNAGTIGVTLAIESNGDLTSSGDISALGEIESLSDISLKENLEIIENPIEKIKELNGYTFNKNGEEKRSAGLVAQEVEKVLPEVVSENSDGIKSLAYGNIVALLVETVKEQQKQIDELKKQISDK